MLNKDRRTHCQPLPLINFARREDQVMMPDQKTYCVSHVHVIAASTVLCSVSLVHVHVIAAYLICTSSHYLMDFVLLHFILTSCFVPWHFIFKYVTIVCCSVLLLWQQYMSFVHTESCVFLYVTFVFLFLLAQEFQRVTHLKCVWIT